MDQVLESNGLALQDMLKLPACRSPRECCPLQRLHAERELWGGAEAHQKGWSEEGTQGMTSAGLPARHGRQTRVYASNATRRVRPSHGIGRVGRCNPTACQHPPARPPPTPTGQQHCLRGPRTPMVHSQVDLRQKQLMGHCLAKQEVRRQPAQPWQLRSSGRQLCRLCPCSPCAAARAAGAAGGLVGWRQGGVYDGTQGHLGCCTLHCLHHGADQPADLQAGRKG